MNPLMEAEEEYFSAIERHKGGASTRKDEEGIDYASYAPPLKFKAYRPPVARQHTLRIVA